MTPRGIFACFSFVYLPSQQIDLRKQNSWISKLSELESCEILEVFAVNAISPYLLNGKLRPLIIKSPHV
jgi:hypothetical protein